MSDEQPERPENVPASAVWVEADQEWELGGMSTSGKKHGPYTYWRGDGTLCNECILREGEPHGPFKRFHENGEVSQEGSFAEGQLHGTRIWHATDSETTERMHEGGIDTSVWRSEMDYDHGKVTAVRHFNREGVRVMPNGQPFPDKPEGLPAEAEYQSQHKRWAAGSAKADHTKTGRWRYWAHDGTPQEDTMYVDGKKHGPTKTYHENGMVSEEGTFEHDARHGVWKRYTDEGKLFVELTFVNDQLSGRYTDWDPEAAAAYDVPAAIALRGDYENGQPAGVWHVLGAGEKRLASRDYGIATTQEALLDSPVFANERRSTAEWNIVAEQCARERRFGEAVVARARAAARSTNIDSFVAALGQLALPTTEEGKKILASEVIENGAEDLPNLLTGFMRGASPAMLCRALSIAVDKVDRGLAALDLINVALLLSPDSKSFLFTRGLVLMRLGLPEQVDIDVAELATVEKGSSSFLSDYNRILFRKFDFWPASETPETYYDALPDKPAQDLATIRVVIAKYAHRLQEIRGALAGYVKLEVPWMFADLCSLADTSVTLTNDSFELDDETVQIEEELHLSTHELPDLVRMARADWSALTWLLWSCGLDKVAMPSTVSPPADFGKACGMAAQRLWRCRDKVHMHGYGAKRSGVPGFIWEGLDIDAMHPMLAGIAEQQYAELAALFRWLSDADVKSPWQDNLRGS